MSRIGMVVAYCGLVMGACVAPVTAQTRLSSPATTQVNETDFASPTDALKFLARALDDGDRNGVLELLWAETDQEHRWAGATAELAEASALLRRAAVEGFGRQAARSLGVDTAATPEAIARIERAQVKIDGDRAVVRPAEDSAVPLMLVRRRNGWRIPVSEFVKDAEPVELGRAVDALVTEARLFRDLAGEVASGRYANAVDARQALDQRIVKTVMPRLESTTQRIPTTRPKPRR